MDWNIVSLCIKELDKAQLFVSSEHRQFFSDLMNCYSDYPFFHKGLCKCMYLSCWDFEHYVIMMDMLNNMTLEKSQDTEEMSENGEYLEDQSEGYDKYIYQLSGAFLNDKKFEWPMETIPQEGVYIMTQALKAAEVIDDVFLKIGK